MCGYSCLFLPADCGPVVPQPSRGAPPPPRHSLFQGLHCGSPRLLCADGSAAKRRCARRGTPRQRQLCAGPLATPNCRRRRPRRSGRCYGCCAAVVPANHQHTNQGAATLQLRREARSRACWAAAASCCCWRQPQAQTGVCEGRQSCSLLIALSHGCDCDPLFGLLERGRVAAQRKVHREAGQCGCATPGPPAATSIGHS